MTFFSPYLASGDTLNTGVVNYWRVCGCSQERAVNDMFGCNKRYPACLFGEGANEIAQRMFAGSKSSFEVQREHSLFGFYSKFISRHAERKVSEFLSDGRSKFKPGNLFFIVGDRLSSFALQYCEKCVKDDLASGKFPAWRVLHQLPFLAVCPRHQCTLISVCASCGAPYDRGNQFRLPGETCSSCGQSRPKMSNLRGSQKGQAALAAVSQEIFFGSATYLRPGKWAALMFALIREMHGVSAAISLLEKSLSGRWTGASLQQVGAQFGLIVPSNTIELELRLLSMCRPFTRLALLVAIRDSLGEEFVTCASDDLTVVPAEVSDALELYEASLESHIPWGAIRLALDGHSNKFIANQTALLGEIRLRGFLNSLPLHLAVRLAQSRPSLNKKQTPVAVGVRREALTRLLALDPGVTRTLLRARYPALVSWLIKFDRDWFDTQLPQRNTYREPYKLSAEKARAFFRKMVTNCIRKDAFITWTGLRSRCPAALRWLLLHDAEWLEGKKNQITSLNSIRRRRRRRKKIVQTRPADEQLWPL